MKRIFWVSVIALIVLGGYTIIFKPDYVVGGLPVHHDIEIKGDTPCTGQETAGRCADKCPNQTDVLIGFKDDGEAICKSEQSDSQSQVLISPSQTVIEFKGK